MGTTDFQIEVFDDLPEAVRGPGGGGKRNSVIAKIVNEIVDAVENGDIRPGQPVRIALYEAGGGASGCAGQIKRRFGPPEANGVKVATRRTKDAAGNEEGHSVFVMYNGKWIVPGEAEKAEADFEAYQVKLRDQSKARAEKKAQEEAA